MDVYQEVRELGFFPYSGADGDLFRRNGTPGIRLSLTSRSYRVQEKVETPWGFRKYEWQTTTETDDPERFIEAVEALTD